ncbi:MAG: HAD family phosphatase [Methylobacteriaceae bacterium]|nr:HAD family phosphatase [Methylobacteriaceae bacterium]
MAQPDHRPDVVVFDVGEVLLDWNPRHLYDKVIADADAREWFLAHVCTPDWNREQDRGRDWGEAVALLARAFPEWSREIEAFHHRWEETVRGPVAGSVDILRRLHAAGAPLYAITNFSAPKFAESRRRFDFLNLFRGVVVSGEAGLIKPDRRIFDLFCARFALAPQRCFFIDDSRANVEAARAVGMQAALFVDPPGFARDLAAAGFSV